MPCQVPGILARVFLLRPNPALVNAVKHTINFPSSLLFIFSVGMTRKNLHTECHAPGLFMLGGASLLRLEDDLQGVYRRQRLIYLGRLG